MGLIEVWLWQTCGPIAYGWIMIEVIFEDFTPFISILHNHQVAVGLETAVENILWE